jgi:hypothetical protein
MGVLSGVALGVAVLAGGGGGSQIMGVTEGVSVGLGAVVGGGAGSHTIGPTPPQAIVVPPYVAIIIRIAFCKSWGNLFHGTMLASLQT